MDRPTIKGQITAVDFVEREDGVLIEFLAVPGSSVAAGRYKMVPDEGSQTIKVTWARERIETALTRWMDYRDHNVQHPPEPHSDLTLVVIDCLRAVLGANDA